MPGDSLTLLLFLFIAAACGYGLARFGPGRLSRSREETSTTGMNPGYLRGVNFLLDDKPDKAIEVFVSMMEVDNETIDTHFALGSLFRRRGEVDRAIRIHQNLIARPNLPKVHREQALFALAEDYLGAGLLDRAEGILVKLADQSARRDDALVKLTALYERQKDWAQAIAARRRIGGNPDSERIVAHYYCELAREALGKGDAVAARNHLKQAQAGGASLVRGAMMRADIALAGDERKTALRLLKRVAEEDTRLLLDVWPAMCRALDGVRGADPLDRFLSDVVTRSPDCLAAITQIALIHDDVEHDVVRRGMLEWLARDATLGQSLEQLGVLTAHQAPDDATLSRIMAGLGVVLRARANYLCSKCGFTGHQLYWQCPSCKSWDQLRPHFLPKMVLLPSFDA